MNRVGGGDVFHKAKHVPVLTPLSRPSFINVMDVIHYYLSIYSYDLLKGKSRQEKSSVNYWQQ